MIEALLGAVTRSIALLLAAVFVCCGTTTLVLRSAESVAFDPLGWQLALSDNDTYRRMPELVRAQAERRPAPRIDASSRLREKVEARLSPADWGRLTELLLPPASTQRVAEDVIQRSIDFLEARRDEVAIDLGPLRETIGGPAGAEAIALIVAAQAGCEGETCADPAEVAAKLDRATLLTEVPPWFVVVSAEEDDLVEDRADLAQIRFALRLLPALLLVPLIGAVLFGARSRAGVLRWFGGPLLVVGAVGLALGALSAELLEPYWLAFDRAHWATDVAPEVLAHGRGVLGSLLGDAVHRLQFEGGVLAVAGLVLVLLSFLVSTHPDRPRP